MPTQTQDLIEAYLLHLRERPASDQTLNTYRWQLNTADRGLPYGLEGANRNDLRAWIWRGDYALSSRALTHAVLTGFYRFAFEHGYLDFNPGAKIPTPKVPQGLPRVATDAHVARLLTESPAPYRLDAHLAAYGGLRCIEISRLHRDHITETSISVHGKGNKFRMVPTHPAIWALTKDLPPGPVSGERTPKKISANFLRFCERIGIEKMSLHRLRGWFATTGYNASHDVRAVQTLLGHSSLATTARYVAVGETTRRAIVTGLPTFAAEDDAGPQTRPAQET